MSTAEKDRCCFIGPGLRSTLKGCTHDAEFRIYAQDGHPNDWTSSCEEHVGAMLGTPTWKAVENQWWRIQAIVRESADALEEK